MEIQSLSSLSVLAALLQPRTNSSFYTFFEHKLSKTLYIPWHGKTICADEYGSSFLSAFFIPSLHPNKLGKMTRLVSSPKRGRGASSPAEPVGKLFHEPRSPKGERKAY